MGGKHFETGVYSYNKFIKKKIRFGYTYRLLGIKKIRNSTWSFIFFSFKNSISGFCCSVNMTYFLRGSDLLWAYSSFLCQVLPTLSSCGFSSFVPLPSFLLPTKWKQWLSKYTPPKTATIHSLVTQLLRPLFSNP